MGLFLFYIHSQGEALQKILLDIFSCDKVYNYFNRALIFNIFVTV